MKKLNKVLLGLAFVALTFVACEKDDSNDMFSENNEAPTISFTAYNSNKLYEIEPDTAYQFKTTLTDSSSSMIEEFTVYYEVNDEEKLDITASSANKNLSILTDSNSIKITGDLSSEGIIITVRAVDSFGEETIYNLLFTFKSNIAPEAALYTIKDSENSEDGIYVYSLDASESSDSDGELILYDFYIDDALIASTARSVIKWTFGFEKKYDIKVQVTDDNGQKSDYIELTSEIKK